MRLSSPAVAISEEEPKQNRRRVEDFRLSPRRDKAGAHTQAPPALDGAPLARRSFQAARLYGRMADALVTEGDEGRGKLR